MSFQHSWIEYIYKNKMIAKYLRVFTHRTHIASFYRFTSDYQNEIITQLKLVKLDKGGDIYSNGYVQNLKILEDGQVTMELKLDQNYRKMKSLIQSQLKSVHWIKNVDIKIASKDQQQEPFKKGNLTNVKKIIAVSSCKGGVGKSTVAVNLAYSIKKLGWKVGIFDADVYGPSLPTLIGKEKEPLEAPEDNPKFIIPIEYEGMKTMSFGFANANKKAVLRGPMVSSIVTSLIHSTLWENLDYLIIDMPPGTGDIQLTLCQEIQFNSAVIVTTPQRLSFIDVVKGIEMFDSLQVPTVSVVENMAEFVCEKCNHTHRPFGPGYMKMLKNQFGIQNSITIPLYSDISKYSDAGAPVTAILPEQHTISQIYNELAESVVKETEKQDLDNMPHVRYETGSSMVIIREKNGKEKQIKAHELRKQCQCALCVDEFSGKQLLDPRKVSEEVVPFKIEAKGNYAVAIIWSDGHNSSIYPYETLLKNGVEVKQR